VRLFVFVLTALLVTLAARSARADAPCAGCKLSLPAPTATPAAAQTPVPLIVALHGDYQPVSTMHEAWKRAALPRGVGVLSLACPWEKGCRGSWWRWNGDPSWVTGIVADVVAKHAIDSSRVYVVGWSGGGSYIGWNAQRFSREFAAIVIFGGGMPPRPPTCGDASTPVYFLVGDKNPFHSLAKDLRDYYVACGAQVTWDLLPGAEHDAEWASLGTHKKAVLDFLLAHSRAPSATVTP
jgi:poly(3-hydroxybutyrate) depolymerase